MSCHNETTFMSGKQKKYVLKKLCVLVKPNMKICEDVIIVNINEIDVLLIVSFNLGFRSIINIKITS